MRIQRLLYEFDFNSGIILAKNLWSQHRAELMSLDVRQSESPTFWGGEGNNKVRCELYIPGAKR